VLLAKNSPESVKLKIRVCKEFKRLKKTIALLASQRTNEEWKLERSKSKQTYLQKSDTVKIFVDYCTEAGSKSAKMYYVNLAKMENKALFIFEQKFKNMREVLNIRQLMQVGVADQIIEKVLKEGMEESMDYHDIFKLAKQRVIQFSEIIGQSPILALTEKN
jgi:hypothetical protein